MNKLILNFLCKQSKNTLGKNRGSVKNPFYKLVNSNFAENNDNLTITEKMRKIVDKDKNLEKGSEEEIKFFQDKKIPLVKHQNIIRSPIYLSIPFLLWQNPFSLSYSFTLLFSNYYLIFLTTFEAAAFFSLGLNQYNLIIMDKKVEDKESVQLKEKVTRKRLAVMFVFFFFICFCSVLGSKYNNSGSMGLIFLSNAYLYTKFSYNITLYGLNKRVFERRMKNVGMNMLLALLLAFIYSRKDKNVKNNILYNI